MSCINCRKEKIDMEIKEVIKLVGVEEELTLIPTDKEYQHLIKSYSNSHTMDKHIVRLKAVIKNHKQMNEFLNKEFVYEVERNGVVVDKSNVQLCEKSIEIEIKL